MIMREENNKMEEKPSSTPLRRPTPPHLKELEKAYIGRTYGSYKVIGTTRKLSQKFYKAQCIHCGFIKDSLIIDLKRGTLGKCDCQKGPIIFKRHFEKIDKIDAAAPLETHTKVNTLLDNLPSRLPEFYSSLHTVDPPTIRGDCRLIDKKTWVWQGTVHQSLLSYAVHNKVPINELVLFLRKGYDLEPTIKFLQYHWAVCGSQNDYARRKGNQKYKLRERKIRVFELKRENLRKAKAKRSVKSDRIVKPDKHCDN